MVGLRSLPLDKQRTVLAKRSKERIVKGVLASFLGALVVACSGCGGGGGGAPAPVAQAAPKAVLIEVYGDSTARNCTRTAGVPAGGICQTVDYAMASPTTEQTVQAQLQAKYSSTVTVSNLGVAGNTVPALITGDGLNLPWAQQMAQSKANIVVLIFGINDSNVASGESAEQFQANVSQLIQVAEAAGKTVVIETANPVNDPTRLALPQYVAAEIVIAQQWSVNVIDQFDYLSAMPDWISMLCDNVHPTQAGYNLKAQFEFQGLDPIVGFAISH